MYLSSERQFYQLFIIFYFTRIFCILLNLLLLETACLIHKQVFGSFFVLLIPDIHLNTNVK